MEQQYIRINKFLKDNFGQHLKYLGKVKPIKTPIDEFYAILDKLKREKIRIKFATGHRDFNGNKELFDLITNCNNFEQVFSAMGGFKNENIEYIKTHLN